jgi:CRISPR system Cascade subunit CasA
LASFNLITESWIPVRTGEGIIEVGLAEVLLSARAYQRLDHPSPLVTAALYRLLLAVLHRALEGPEDIGQAASWFQNGLDNAKIARYLEQHHDRFDLFHPDIPFFQVSNLPLEGYSQHWTRLTTELGSSNTNLLYNYALRPSAPPASDAVSCAEVARRLLEHQTFCLGGLIRKFITSAPGAPSATAAMAIVQGDTLHETLCLNLVTYPPSARKNDLAVWEREPLTTDYLKTGPKDFARGIVQRYTWPSRAVRLEPETVDGATVVRFIAYASGVSFQEGPPDDPMVAYRPDGTDPNIRRPLSFREGRELWRDFQALVPSSDSTNVPDVIQHARLVYRTLRQKGRAIPVTLFGHLNEKAKVKLWRAERYDLPPAVLSDHNVRGFIEQRLQEAETLGSALEGAARVLAEHLLTLGERKPQRDDITRLSQSFPHRLTYWSTLESSFRKFLKGLIDDFENVANETSAQWQVELEKTARRAWALTAAAAGDDARALRATARAEGILFAQFRR